MRKALDVKILIGVPASGKSTWSIEYVRKNPNYVRLNRDSYRYMLKNEGYCEPKIEDLITDLFFHAIDVTLAKNLSILIDNTNLRKSHIDEIIKYVEHRANVSFMVFDISLEKAIERDATREKSVGEEVIKKMYKAYSDLMDGFSYVDQHKRTFIYKDPERIAGLQNASIFDLDGTLAHTNGKRDYFDYQKCDRDDLDGVVHRAYVRHKAAGDIIIIVTGRAEEARQTTEDWLQFYGVEYDLLLMRKDDDFRKDNIVKAEIYNKHIKGKFNVEVVYDDRQKVVNMWRSLGLKVFQVMKGDY